ncbi:MAG: hypothetical protein F2817_18675 [Actinobacteria bacterium]|nr:hypothetical protein [Actinomycetota bacterium]
MIGTDATGRVTGQVVAPAETTLPRTEFDVADVSAPVTKVISFSRSATDPTPPTVTCDTSGAGAADGTWSSDVPRITCTSTDDGTGLADPKDQTVTVTPQVPASGEYEGTYPAVVKVCDKADNCTEKTVPVNVDKKAPTIESSTPGHGATYAQGQDVEIHYSCKDGGSGVKVCRPAQPGAPGTGTGSTGGGEAGTKLDTSTPGRYVVYIECTDAAGNTRTEKVEYEVQAPAASAPVSTTAPTLSGTPRVGVSLSSSLGGWQGTAPITFTRRWQRCDATGDGCTDVAGATGTSYVPVAADVDRRLRVVVTATNEKGTASRRPTPRRRSRRSGASRRTRTRRSRSRRPRPSAACRRARRTTSRSAAPRGRGSSTARRSCSPWTRTAARAPTCSSGRRGPRATRAGRHR